MFHKYTYMRQYSAQRIKDARYLMIPKMSELFTHIYKLYFYADILENYPEVFRHWMQELKDRYREIKKLTNNSDMKGHSIFELLSAKLTALNGFYKEAKADIENSNKENFANLKFVYPTDEDNEILLYRYNLLCKLIAVGCTVELGKIDQVDELYNNMINYFIGLNANTHEFDNEISTLYNQYKSKKA